MHLNQIAIRTGKHHNISVGIADPDFPVAGIRVHVRLDDHARAEHAGICYGAIEIVGFKPKQDPMTKGSRIRIAEVGVVVIALMMKLHQQLAVTDELLVLSTAMAALAAQ